MPPLTLRSLLVENFGGIRLVETPLGDGLNLVNGDNGSGKSSLLAAVRAITNGKDGMPPIPVHGGAERAHVVGTLSDGGSIELTETKGGTFRLVLKDEKGHLVPSPAAALKALRGYAGLDPVAMAWATDPREQLVAAVGVDVAALDREEATLRQERTIVGREGKTLAGAVETMPAKHEDVPEAEVSIGGLFAEVSAAEAAKRANDDARRALAEADRRLAEASAAELAAVDAAAKAESAVVADPEADPDVAALERALAEARSTCARNAEQRRRAGESRRTLDAAITASTLATAARESAEGARATMAATTIPADPDVAAIRARVVGAEETNRKVRENAARASAQAKLDAARAKYATLTDQIAEVEARRAKALADAGLDVAGLKVTADAVLLHGRAWAAASTGERLTAAIEVRCVANPPLRVAWTTEGDKLDDKNLAFVRALCEERGLQLLMERTGIRDEGALVLVDGELAGAVTQNAEPAS